MKKSLIALTLAALPVAAMADVTLYGTIKAGVETSRSVEHNGGQVVSVEPVPASLIWVRKSASKAKKTSATV